MTPFRHPVCRHDLEIGVIPHRLIPRPTRQLVPQGAGLLRCRQGLLVRLRERWSQPALGTVTSAGLTFFAADVLRCFLKAKDLSSREIVR